MKPEYSSLEKNDKNILNYFRLFHQNLEVYKQGINIENFLD